MFFLLITFLLVEVSRLQNNHDWHATVRTFHRKNCSCESNQNSFDWSKISQDLLLLSVTSFIFIQIYLDNGIVLVHFEDTSIFIMIRNFVPVNETGTDFCSVSKCLGIEVPKSVLKYCPASHIHDFKHKMLQIL